MMRGQWYKVPSELFNEPSITKADMAVFAYVADRLKGDTKGVSIRSIICATELSRRQVQKSLKKLCEYRFLKAIERPGDITLYRQTLLPLRVGGKPGTESEPNRDELIGIEGKEVNVV